MSAASSSPHRSLLLFHLGRLSTYLALGSIAGTFGKVIDGGVVSKASHLLSACILFYLGWRVIFPKLKALHSNAGWKLVGRAKGHKLLFPAILGAVTGLLPCGWLYGFLAIALASGGIERSILVMFCFWLGTLPLLSLIGAGSTLIVKNLRFLSHPRLKAALLFLAAFTSIAPHYLSSATPSNGNNQPNAPLICHGKGIAK